MADPKIRRMVDTADPQQVEELRRRFPPVLEKARALLCLDCDSLFEGAGAQRCPACGSSVSQPAARALDRRPAVTVTATLQAGPDPARYLSAVDVRAAELTSMIESVVAAAAPPAWLVRLEQTARMAGVTRQLLREAVRAKRRLHGEPEAGQGERP